MRVYRCFAFVDMCGFTRLNDTLGDDEALNVLSAFRAVVRRMAPDHAVRVGKWLGDGAMFVSIDIPLMVRGMMDLTERLESADIVLPLRIGIAAGNVILFEGDDFIGMSINLASRLCDAAGPGEILATEEVATAMAGEFAAAELGERLIPGIVTPVSVWRFLAPTELGGELPASLT
jgi:class 3 adenylate cyclase